MQTIGDRLEEARKRKGVSLREAAEATKIRGDYLQKFEANQFDFDLAEIYVRGFLRNYSNYLKLQPDRILGDYDALGRGASRPRQPSREVYGRMELSISTPEEREERGEPKPGAATVEPPARQTPSLPRGGSNLPKAPALDPALVFKAGIVLVILLAGLLVTWVIKSLYVASPPAPGSAVNHAVAAPATPIAPTMTLIALGPVRVTVTEMDNGAVILPETALDQGETRVVARPGPVLVRAYVGANVQFEVNGRRYAMPAGHDQVQIGE